MHDAHFHMSKELFDLFKENKMKGICNVDSVEEYECIQSLLKEYPFEFSVGIHPWKADQINFEEMKPLFSKTKFIGEIGLDNTWCDIDLDIQKRVFIQQLEFASKYQKPVILHVKGMEQEALNLIKQYKNTYIVHWYSCLDFLKEYDEVVDYFTVGPSVGIDEAVTNLVKNVDVHKLLLESDGIDAIEWAIQSRDYLKMFNHSIEQINEIKQMDCTDILDQNFNQLLKRA